MVLVAEAEGSVFAFQVLKELQRMDNKARICHLIAHGIGEGTYKREPSNWQENIRTVSRNCGYGAMHGIMENYVATLPGGTFTAERVRTLCGEEPFSECTHILGHLVLVETGINVDESLELCRVFKGLPRQVENCYNGVFMEYQSSQNLIEHGLVDESWLDWPSRIDDIEAMCRSYGEGLEAVACWTMIAHAAGMTYNNNAQEVFAFCDTAPVEEGRRGCKRHAIGIFTAAAAYDLEKMKAVCLTPQPSDPEFVSDCYIRLAMTSLSTFPSKKDEVRAYCLDIPSIYREECLKQVEFAKK